MNEAQKVQAIIEILRTGTGAQDAKRDLEGVQAAAGGLNEHLKTLGATMAGVLSAREIIRFGVESVKAFAESEAGLNRLNNTLRASGQFSQAYVVELRTLATTLAEVTVADDDAIMAAERTMVSFGAQRRDMERLTKAALDLSVGMGVDLQTAASQLGRAIAGETQSFSRLGFEIDENADAGARLEQVLSQIETRFKGLAAGEMNGLAGATSTLTEAWDDLKKSIGGTLGPGAETAIRGLTSIVGALREAADILGKSAPPSVSQRDMENLAITAQRTLGILEEKNPDKAAELRAARERLQMAMEPLVPDENGRALTSSDYATQRAYQEDAYQAAQAQIRAVSGSKAGATALSGDIPFADGPTNQARPATGRAGNEFYGPPEAPIGEQFGPTNAEANEQRRRLAREATDELKALEQELTLEAIRAGDYRLGKVNEEYDRRVATYRRLAEEHKITEAEMLSMTRDAAFERDRAVEEGLQRQREAEKRAHDESRNEWKQTVAQIEQMFASQVAGAIVNAFRTGKFEADKFFSDLFAQIAQLIIQEAILRALRSVWPAAEGVTAYAAAGLPPTFAADGITQLNHATYFPKFNVVAGEAGMEMMTVLAKPRPMAFGGVQAITGFAQGRELAVMPAGGAAALAGQGGGGREAALVRVMLDPGLKAEIVRESVGSAEVQITQSLGRDTGVRRAVQAVAGG